MGWGIKFRIESAAIAALAKRLADVDRKAARKAIREGVNEATRIVMWDAKERVRVRSGQLRKALGRKIKVYRGGAAVVGIVGPRRGFKIQYRGQSVDPSYYAHLVEYGRREVVAGTAKGKRTGKRILVSGFVPGVSGLPAHGTVFGKRVRSVPPHPFLRPAWDANKARVKGEIIRALHRELRKFHQAARSRYRRAA